MARRIGAEARQIDDRELGLEGRELSGARTAQQMADEGRVPCELGKNARVQAVVGIGAGEEVLNKKLTR